MKYVKACGWGALLVGFSIAGPAWARDSLCAQALAGLARHMSVEHSPLNAGLTYVPLIEPEVTNTYVYRGEKHEVMEVARLTHAEDPVLQALIGEIEGLGAEVRLLKGRVSEEDGPFVRWGPESPYSWVNLGANSPSFLKRIVGFDPTQPRALASLAHEIQHLRLWTELYRAARARGEEEIQACWSAWNETETLDMILEGERRAVTAEIAMEIANPDHPYNRPYAKPGAVNVWERGYAARITYPEYQVVRTALKKHPDLVPRYLRAWIEHAEDVRARALAHMTPEDPLRAYWSETPLLKLMLGEFGHVRLEAEGKLEDLQREFDRLRP